jgi:hypothetical protein
MQSSDSTYALDLAEGPALRETELGVHIIYVSGSYAEGHGPAALAQIASHIGTREPTDIVVHDGQPWHCAGLPGHRKELRAHPKVHDDYRDTVLVVTGDKNESVVWWSETPFSEVTIAPSDHTNRFYPEALTPAPRYPFDGPLEVCIESCNGRDLYVVRSTVPLQAAEGHMYKIAFKMAGARIDPDMYCGAP